MQVNSCCTGILESLPSQGCFKRWKWEGPEKAKQCSNPFAVNKRLGAFFTLMKTGLAVELLLPHHISITVEYQPATAKYTGQSSERNSCYLLRGCQSHLLKHQRSFYGQQLTKVRHVDTTSLEVKSDQLLLLLITAALHVWYEWKVPAGSWPWKGIVLCHAPAWIDNNVTDSEETRIAAGLRKQCSLGANTEQFFFVSREIFSVSRNFKKFSLSVCSTETLVQNIMCQKPMLCVWKFSRLPAASMTLWSSSRIQLRTVLGHQGRWPV